MVSSGVVYWLFGLSGAGKTTLANSIKEKIGGIILDGNEVRKGLNKDLSLTNESRYENIRRIAEVAKIISNNGINCIVSVICPLETMRLLAKEILEDKIKLIYLSTPLEECVRRDVKGLYKRALNGEIKNMTGISAPFETPKLYDIIIDTSNKSIEECLNEIC